VSVSVTIDPRFLERILRGPLARARVRARTDRVEALAQRGGDRHGSMGDAVRSRVADGADGLPRGEVWVAHSAGRYVLEGTRPHLIRPRRARGPKARLRFRARSGDVVFTKLVRHPGYRGDNFLLEALRRGR
jgi:hypothetical protein